jgi:DNA-directed RNA polymerase specialized sigma24 family protein
VELMLDTYQDEVYGYCARLVPPQHLGSLFHQVLVNAISSLARFDLRTSVRAWFFGIARRVVILHHQRDPERLPGALQPGYVPSRGWSPAEHLEGEALDRALASEAGWSALEPAVLEVLQLALWHGLYLLEVSHIVDRPVLEVRSMAARGLAALTGSLFSDGTGPC